jgi:Leucine-rich repeat (LRR) protein
MLGRLQCRLQLLPLLGLVLFPEAARAETLAGCPYVGPGYNWTNSGQRAVEHFGPGLLVYCRQANLTAYPNGVSSDVVYLALVGNQIASLPPGVFSTYSLLQRLGLTSNVITSLPPMIFDGLSRLQNLGIANNNLCSLPPGVFSKAGLTSLQRLSLQQNYLTVIESGTFENLPSLNALLLSHNGLQVVAPLLLPLTQLVFLDVSFNNLSVEVNMFISQSKLNSLLLGGNNITFLPVGVFSGAFSGISSFTTWLPWYYASAEYNFELARQRLVIDLSPISLLYNFSDSVLSSVPDFV